MKNQTILSLAISCILWGTPVFAATDTATATTTKPTTTDTTKPTTTTTTKPTTTTDTKPTTTTTDKPTEPPAPKLEDFDLTDADMPTMDAERLKQLNTKAFTAFSKQNVKDIPAAAFAGLKPSQIAQLPVDAISVLKTDQVTQMPASTMLGLSAAQIIALPLAVVKKLPVLHFKSLSAKELQKLDGKDLGKLLFNLDKTQIKPEDVKTRLPEGWSIAENGALTAPSGTVLTLPTKSAAKFDTTVKITMPSGVPDLTKTFALGGEVDETNTVLLGVNETLKNSGYKDFEMKQGDGGILTVAGSGDAAGSDFTFIPEADSVKQVSSDVTSGLSKDSQGYFTITTGNKQQLTVVAMPKDAKQLAETLGAAGALKIDKRGVAILDMRKDTSSERAVYPVVFDALSVPTASDKLAGLYITENSGEVVYTDGTAQKLFPSVPLPDKFIEKAKLIEGVEEVQFNANGTFSVKYKGSMLKLTAKSFDAKVTTLADGEKISTEIAVQPDGTLNYTTQDGTDKLEVTLNIGE